MRTRILLLAALLSTALGCARDRKTEPEILWDTWGVPHVYAADDQGRLFALGFAEMRSHGDRILELYGKAAGRAAELWGEAYLDSDRYVHTLGGPGLAAEAYANATPAQRAQVDAFADGINAYATAHGDTLDPERRRALPVTGRDVVQAVAYSLWLNGMNLTPDAVDAAAQRFAGAAGATGPAPAARAASNGWVLGPSKTASGKPILLSNTHMPWPSLPGGENLTWFEAQLGGEDFDLYGVGLIGLPALTLGFNDRKGWTITALAPGIDLVDYYELTLSGDGYVHDGAVRSFDERAEEIEVRQADGTLRTERLVVRSSVHGPVLATSGGKALAIRFAHADPIAAGSQLFAMARARDAAEFAAALDPEALPGLNVLYADREGHTLYTLTGPFPDRAGLPGSGGAFLPGDSPEALWHGYLPRAALPAIADPATGWLQNTNDAPWTATLPSSLDPAAYPAGWPRGVQATLREAASIRAITTHTTLSLDDVVAAKFSTRSELADRVLDGAEGLLAAAATSGDEPTSAAAEVLRTWDRRFDPDSSGAVLFAFWAMQLQPGVLGGQPLPDEAFAIPTDPARPLDTPRGLADPGAAAAALGTAARIVQSSFGSLQVPWGAFLRLRVGDLDRPGLGAPGEAFGMLPAAYGIPQPDGPLALVAGDSFVLAVDFADPDGARAVLAYGNATQPGSPHRQDQLSVYATEQLREVWRTREAVEAHLELREVPR